MCVSVMTRDSSLAEPSRTPDEVLAELDVRMVSDVSEILALALEPVASDAAVTAA